MSVRKQAPRILRYWTLAVAPFAIASFALLLCAAGALAQCSVNIAPGETRFLQASNGDATLFTRGVSNFGQGAFYLNENKVEADAIVPAGALGLFGGSAYGLINYVFCIPAKREDSISATIMGEAEWNGLLFFIGLTQSSAPSVHITASLFDLGTEGTSAPIPVFSQTLLDSTTTNVKVQDLTAGGSLVSGSGLLNMNLPSAVLTGHIYEVQFKLECNTPTGILAVGVGCIFGSDLPINISNLTIPTLVDFAKLSNVTVRLGDDQYGAILAVGEAVASLGTQVQSNSRSVLELERENAQLLGILNQILSLLSANLADRPATPTPGKGKTGDPKPPMRPVRPAANDPVVRQNSSPP
jgi:hypothetical protein